MLSAGCLGSGFPEIVDATRLSGSFGTPKLARVRDAGTVSVPTEGKWNAASDGVACPGELLLLEGSGFGRQPTVTIGGKATEVVARTNGGGILARVPRTVTVGEVDVQVSTSKGASAKRFTVRRLAVALYGDRVYALNVQEGSVSPLGEALAVEGARKLRLSSDGGVAYVLATRAERDVIAIIDLGAVGGPRIVGEVGLEQRATHLVVADAAPVALVVGEGRATVIDLQRPRAPVRYTPVDLPRELKQARAFDLSPDGALLAGLVADGNRLVLAELKGTSALAVVSSLDLLPGERFALARELAFSPDGDTLWVVSGSNTSSLPSVQPTRLTAVRLVGVQPDVALSSAKPASRVMSLWRTTTVPGASAPIRLALARGQRVMSGATISLPPDKAAVFVTGVSDALFRLGEIDLDSTAGAQEAQKLWKPSKPGMIARGEMSGGGGPLTTSTEILSAIDATPDAHLLIATALRVTPADADKKLSLDFGVSVTRTFGGNPDTTFIKLGQARAKDARPPFQIGDVRIQ